MKLEGKNFDEPDMVRELPNGQMAVVEVGGMTVGRGTLEPGWKWSTDVKPIVGTESCEMTHAGAVLRGRIHVRMDDGTEREFGPGDVYTIPPGHDAWIVGDETYEAFEWSGSAGEYAKPV